MRPNHIYHRTGWPCALSLLLLLLLFSIAGAGPSRAANFAYTIDDQPVLLYKIIQWWYDAQAADAPWVCGRTLACHTTDPIQITYVQSDRRLSLRFEAGFAELVSAGAPEAGVPSMDLRATGLDPNYFGDVTAKLCPDPACALGRICVEGVAPDQADRLAAMGDRLEVVLAGTVCGLVDGRIALAHGQGLLKVCPASASAATAYQAATASQPVTLALRNRHADAVLAIFVFQPAGGGK